MAVPYKKLWIKLAENSMSISRILSIIDESILSNPIHRKTKISIKLEYMNTKIIKHRIINEKMLKVSNFDNEKSPFEFPNSKFLLYLLLSFKLIKTMLGSTIIAVKNNILSLVILSELKEGNSSERIIIQTYNEYT